MKIYQRYEGLSPVYQGYLTNHLPMYYCILRELQVPEDQIVEKLDHYKHEKDLYSMTDPTYPRSEFEQEYINRTSYYLGELHKLGTDVVVGNVLNEFSSGLYGALFHGIIRLAYALKCNDDLLIAQGLAYLELVAVPIDFSTHSVAMDSLLESFEELKQTRSTITFDETHISTMERIEFLAAHPGVQKNLHHLEHGDSHRKKLLEWWLKEYQQTQSFYTLHVITGFHALLELEEYLFDFSDALDQFVVIAQLCMIVSDTKTILTTDSLETWDRILEKVIELTNVHDVKLVYSLRQLSNVFNLTLCNEIASAIIQKT